MSRIGTVWFQHGYQKEEKGLGSVSLKVKGVGHTRWDDAPDAADAGYMPTRGLGQMRVQDAVDIVYPPKEEGAMFLTTNFVDVPRQSRGRCPSLNTEDACSADSDCPKATPSDSMIGYRTGVCSLSRGSLRSKCGAQFGDFRGDVWHGKSIPWTRRKANKNRRCCANYPALSGLCVQRGFLQSIPSRR